ncbi:hypothetical protein AB0H43_14160 [Hamadaea sp. NPDC050747]|uniref:hypothetical protein n=1 Tax=Hamadaea sp. NPDC050747 TaxID=3155789 RepID=UPI00340F9163
MSNAMKRSAIIAVALALVAISTPASAASAPADPAAPLQYGTTSANSGASTESLWCEGEAAPDPLYSASNNTVQYGAKTICNHVDTLSIRIEIWTIVGVGDHQTEEYQGQAYNSGVATNLVASGSGKCLVRTTGRWYVKVWATAVQLGGELPPYPAYGPVKTLACSDMV